MGEPVNLRRKLLLFLKAAEGFHREELDQDLLNEAARLRERGTGYEIDEPEKKPRVVLPDINPHRH